MLSELFLMAALAGTALSQYQAQPKIRTNDGDLHLQGGGVVIDTPGASLRLPNAFVDLANSTEHTTRALLAAQLATVNEDIRGVERRQADSITEAVAAIASSTTTLAGLIESTNAAQILTLVAASVAQSASIAGAVASQCGGASFVRADPANATADAVVTVWGRNFIPAAAGLYQCSFRMHDNRLRNTTAVAVNSTALVCPAPDVFGLPDGACDSGMVLNVFENGNRLSHVYDSAAGFAMNAVATSPAFNWTVPAITVERGGDAPTVTGFAAIANFAYGDVTATATSSDQRVVQTTAISVRLVGNVATVSFATLDVERLNTTITVVISNSCGSATQSFIVMVVGGISRFAPHYRVQTNAGNNTNHPGIDLSRDGLQICYGWRNTGNAYAPSHEYMRAACGQYKRILIGGWRCGVNPSRGNMIRYANNGAYNSGNYFTPITLSNNRRFINFLPNDFSTATVHYNNMDTQRRYKWMTNRPWYLLGRAGNGWGDPGRLWEPSATGGAAAETWSTDTRNCGMGHVLSRIGNQGSDQSNCCGDTYVIYGDPTSI